VNGDGEENEETEENRDSGVEEGKKKINDSN
jgi:hypothetical protein